MTNVPDNLREAWKEIYVLFDTHYGMNCMDDKAWAEFWNKANSIYLKYVSEVDLLQVLDAVGEMILKLYKRRNGIPEEPLTWKADEAYPYPKTATNGKMDGVKR